VTNPPPPAMTPAERMAKRDRLGELLATAAELEHSVICQYLFVAFSMKDHPDEGGVSWEQLEAMRRWQATILLIARQEMEHLGLVSNLLTAIGEAPHFLRPEFPIASSYFPAYDPPSLEPFGVGALQRLVRLERPATIEAADAELVRVHEVDVDAPVKESVASLYEEIEQLMADLDGPDLWIGPPSAQRETAEVIPVPVRGLTLPPNARIYDISFTPVGDLTSARAVIQQIIEEGEGGPGTTSPSHFSRLLGIVAELRQVQAKDPSFAPARAVMRDPKRQAVTNPAALAVFDLFADAYDAVILLLMRYFGQTDETAPEVLGLQQAVFFPMMTAVVRPLGEVLMQLPAGSTAGVNAGPSFAFGRRLAFLPHREAAWSLIGQHLASMADTAMSVAAGGYAEPIGKRLQFVAENLARISSNFELSMDPPRGIVTPPPAPPPPAPPAASLIIQFHGHVLIRLPTDPDPPDEPRGVSGYTFAFAGEPDLDRVLYLQAPATIPLRSYSPPIGVTVYAANRVAGDDVEPVTSLLGATVDLLDSPRFENRNWTLTLPGFEPVYPFRLRIAAGAIAIERSAPLNPADPDQPLWEASEAALLAHGARGMEYEPETIGRATGVWDSLGVAKQRLALLLADLAKETDPIKQSNLRGRIAELQIGIASPNDRRTFARYFVERFAFPMLGSVPSVSGTPAELHGTLDTTASHPWVVSYWLGSWDPDTLTAFFEGSLQIAYAPG
jgi:rubrerythrin